MAKKFYALKGITMGPPAADGGMGTVLTEILGATVKGTATLTSTTPETTDVEIEETDEIYDELETKAAVWTLAASTYNVSALTMKEFFGGTVLEGVWSSPVVGETVKVERSVVAETRTGIKFSAVKMKLTGTANLAFDKTKLGQIDWTAKVLKPDKANTPAFSIDFGV
ncbi:hypothetical protein [Pedobacter antarcticus]|uniref:hypothetical protein n=1 Tax=Pedobacter antarcticus TaxID=34086 RepID=UPI00292D8C35|nr:hypothetical protein [Pedobacter antarcticus]